MSAERIPMREAVGAEISAEMARFRVGGRLTGAVASDVDSLTVIVDVPGVEVTELD